MSSWQIQEAKQRFSELVRKAMSEGPQMVTRHGEEVVVVVSLEEFGRRTSVDRDFKQFILDAPDLDDLEISRDETPARKVELSR